MDLAERCLRLLRAECCGDLAPCLVERLGGDVLDRINASDRPAERRTDGADDRGIRCREHGIRDLRAGRAGIGGLLDSRLGRCLEPGGAGGVGDRGSGLHLGSDRGGACLISDDDLRDRALLRRGIAGAILLILRGDFRVGRDGLRLDLRCVDDGVADDAAFGDRVARDVATIEGVQLDRKSTRLNSSHGY